MNINFYTHNHLLFQGNPKPNYYQMVPDLKDYINAGRMKESDIKGVAGKGGLSVIFDLGDDEVLKCSLENPLEFRKHNSSFDITFLSSVEKFGKTYFVKEAKADTKNVTQKDCKAVIAQLYKEGFEPSIDLDQYKLRQIGIYKGKSYLLDTRAALPQPDKFSRYVYNFCNINKRVFFPNKVSDLDFSIKHVDETPRANLTFRQGIAKMWEVAKTNLKYGKKPFSLRNSIALLFMK